MNQGTKENWQKSKTPLKEEVGWGSQLTEGGNDMKTKEKK